MSSLRFGPEWMRKPSRTQLQPSPEPITNHNGATLPSSASSYSALVSPNIPTTAPKRDQAHPFRYTKEELVRIYKEGGGKGGLGLEVDRWEGVTHEIGSEPVSLREMTEEEKKHFAGSLNSELRRRQSTDYLSPLSTQNLGVDRPRLNHANSGAVSPMRERFSGLGIKRRDSLDTNPVTIPRKLSLSSTQGPLGSPGLPSPRTRTGQSPGFDGVLSGDSWLARKRASDAKMNGTTPRGVAGEDDDKRLGIPEEDIGHPQPASLDADPDAVQPQVQAYDSTKLNDPGQPLEANFVNTATDHSTQNNGVGVDSPIAPVGPPPGLGLDLASVEWSYLDPQGQVQGPFRADIMQKWYDDGYFAASLYMRRTHLDNDWTTVAELSRRAGNDKPFLSPLTFATPPGLHTDVYATQNPISYNAPYQPSPIRTLRASTLDTYLNPSSVPASPASSFGTGRSPDPSAYNGRGVIGEAPVGSRVLGFQTGADQGFGAQRRAQFNDAGSYKGFPNRASTLDSHGFNNSYNTANSPWPAPTYDHHLSNHSSASSSPFLNHLAPQPAIFDNTLDRNITVPNVQDIHGAPMFSNHDDIANLGYHNIQTNVPQPITQEQVSPLYPVQAPVTAEPQPAPVEIASSVATAETSWPPSPVVAPPAAAESIASPVETASPVSAPAPAPVKAWSTIAKPTRQADASPWYIASTVVSDDQWKEVPDAEASPSQTVETSPVQETSSPVETPKTEPPPAKANPEAPTSSTPSPVEPPAAPPAKQPRKASTSAATKPPVAPKAAPSPVTPTVTPKTAWSTEDDKKPSAAPMSLREIQEAEAKKAEAKKLADRERERAARVVSTASPVTEDSAPFIASWGLPTSQAGGRNNNGPKDATTANAASPSASTPAASTPPAVWTTPKTQATKKTMKEIQEEEEKRKKMATKESVAQAASRRAYAESTAKPTPGNAWTTVGPSGKTNLVTAATPVRPAITTNTSAASPTTVPRVNGTAATKPPTPVVVKASTPVSRVAEEFPAAPSHEFLKWLGEALKGLNSSVNVEEIISMLLSFPVEPDSSTLEIISDLIYANSTTLDGRRFANDFASRRKADAARPKTGGASAAKIASIADVVKAQPKPAQPEWGFKVVNKKKKGGRA